MLNPLFSYLGQHPQVAKTGKHGRLRYLIAKTTAPTKDLAAWLDARQFLDYENKKYQLSQPFSMRAHHTLYQLSPFSEHPPLLMKVSQVSQRYKWARRMEIHIQKLFKDYNLNAFHATLELHPHIPAIVEPWAYWSEVRTWTDKKSYFLYRYLSVDEHLMHLYEKQKVHDEACYTFYQSLAHHILCPLAKMHQARWRHYDLIPKNIGLVWKNSSSNTENVAPRADELSQVYFFDYDKCKKASLKTPGWLKLLFDLKCFSTVGVPQLRRTELIDIYLRHRQIVPSKLGKHLIVLADFFWRQGGFLFWRPWLRIRAYKKGRHLKY